MRVGYVFSYALAGYAICIGVGSFGLVPAYPSGWATTTVPLLSLLGILAGTLLLLRYRIAVPVMIVYLMMQAAVVIVDPSGPLFRQAIFWGWQRITSHSVNGVIISMHGTGENYWAWIPMAFLTAVILLGLHPPFKALRISPRIRTACDIVAVAFAVVLAAYLCVARLAPHSPAVARISCDVAGTSVWMNGHDLGRAPLTITLATLQAMHLSAKPSPDSIRLRSDCSYRGFLLQNASWQAKITFQPPSNLSGLFLPFPTPWADCAQIIVSGSDNARKALLVPRRTVQVAIRCDPKSRYVVLPGRRFHIRTVISNTGTKHYQGSSAQIHVQWKSFADRWDTAGVTADPAAGKTIIRLPPKFCDLSAGAARAQIITLVAPRMPGNYCFRFAYELLQSNGRLCVDIPVAYALVRVTALRKTIAAFRRNKPIMPQYHRKNTQVVAGVAFPKIQYAGMSQ